MNTQTLTRWIIFGCNIVLFINVLILFRQNTKYYNRVQNALKTIQCLMRDKRLDSDTSRCLLRAIGSDKNLFKKER